MAQTDNQCALDLSHEPAVCKPLISQNKDTEAQKVYNQSLKAACRQIQAWNPGLRVQSTPFSITGLPEICQQYKDYEKGRNITDG